MNIFQILRYSFVLSLSFIVIRKSYCFQEKMILYTFYTPSHEILLHDWFMPSLKDNFEVVIERFEQTCPTGSYMNAGWTQTMLSKIELILKAIQDNPGDIIIYADIDIQFFEPIEPSIRQSLKQCDLVLQQDCNNGPVCAGFMAFKANQATHTFFSLVHDRMIKNKHKSDQPIINQLLLQEKYDIQWDYLPVTFFGTGTLSFTHFANKKTWYEGDIVIMPPNILLHHANYTTNTENKIKLLQYVKDHRNDPQCTYVNSEKQHKKMRKERIAQRAKQRKSQLSFDSSG